MNSKQILQKEQIFNLVHLKQKKGWQPKEAIIIIYTNPFLMQ